jgi:membrane protein YdbS with pleckstrin-like domain
MTDSFELILQVCPAPGDNAGGLAEWLRAELLYLNVQGVDRLPGEAVQVGAKGSADIPALLLVQLDPNELQVVLAKVADWMARSDRVVGISAGGHTLKLDRLTRPPRGKVIDSSLVPGTEVSRVRSEDEIEAVIDVIPSTAADRDSVAPGPSKDLVPLRPHESLSLIPEPSRGRTDLSRMDRFVDARLLVKGGINIEALPRQEFRRTAAFTGISSLLASGFAVLLSIVILAAVRRYHRFSLSTSYPIHRVYQGIVRYFVLITPPPGSSHILLVYTVYLAVLPVLFAVVFMHLKVGSTRLIFATAACAIFMAAPFAIVITSIRVGSTNCGSWNYPGENSGPECYNALTIAFRIAFAVGIIGLAVPIIYLIRGRQDGQKHGLLLRTLIACANFVMAVFRFFRRVARREAGDGRDVAAGQRAEAAVQNHLLPHERRVIIVRRHPAILIGPSVLALAGPVAAAVLTATALHGNVPLITAVWTVWLLLFIRLIWKAANWNNSFFVVTSGRLILLSGVLTKKVDMLPLTKVTDMSFRRPYIGRLLGFGAFVVESAGLDRTLQTIDYVPYPEQLYLEICGLIFKDPGETDD